MVNRETLLLHRDGFFFTRALSLDIKDRAPGPRADLILSIGEGHSHKKHLLIYMKSIT